MLTNPSSFSVPPVPAYAALQYDIDSGMPPHVPVLAFSAADDVALFAHFINKLDEVRIVGFSTNTGHVSFKGVEKVTRVVSDSATNSEFSWKFSAQFLEGGRVLASLAWSPPADDVRYTGDDNAPIAQVRDAPPSPSLSTG